MSNFTWTPITSDEIKWALIDFDKTVANNTGFPNYFPLEPMSDAVEYLNKINDLGYKITIFTARPWADYSNLEKWCKHYKIPVRRIICGKPLGRFFIDDLAISYRGDWKETYTALISFLEETKK